MDYSFFKSNFAKASKFRWDFINNFESSKKWDLLAKQYEDSFLLEENLKIKFNKQIIPKIIHQIWIGPRKLPNNYKKWMNTWKIYNPEWEYILWDEDMINKLNLKNQLAYKASKNPGFKSDIARYEILNKYGGIYLDTDFQCLKSIPNNLLFYEFVSCIVFSFSPEIANGMIMSKPNSPLLKKIINSIYVPKNKNNSYEIISATGPYALTNAYFNLKTKDQKKGLILPSDYFYPFPNFLITRKPANYKDFITDKSIGLHHWEMSWIKGNLIKRIIRKIIFVFKKLF